ncbi:MAG: phosphate ABC transporter permease PstA [Anaerolineae bacterium]|nr:phosphate ABC transporter permease PstA [Anaerolineae bacterium]
MNDPLFVGQGFPSTRGQYRWERLKQRLAFTLLWASGAIAILALLAVVITVVLRGIGIIDLEFLFTSPRGGISGEGGIFSTIVTTLYLVILTLGIATPLGVGAAIYFVEYASDSHGKKVSAYMVQVARFGVETLAGVPSIIFGLFGYILFVSTLHFGFSLLSAGLAGACLILPVSIRTAEEALKTVPRSYREASLALGATKWQTIWKVVLPAAGPGIATGIILNVGRVISETAVFYVTLGGSYKLPSSLLSGGRTMALHLYYLAMETKAFDKAMGTGVVLIITIVVINLIVRYLSAKLAARG